MKLLKLFALLVMFVGVLTLAQEPICAFGACEDACQGSLNVCSSNSQMQYDWCSSTVENNFSGCYQDADIQYEECIDFYCGGPWNTACIQMCEERRDGARDRCYDNYFDSLLICDSAQSERDVACQNDYSSCLGNCP
jgi:hypothetical protein